MSPEAFAEETGVSRETLARLRTYAALLAKWQVRINLVGPATLPDLWRRHMLDSAQLWPLAPANARCWVDIGSGAGFPGLVLAILGAPEMHLVESDQRKAVFLSEAIRATGAPATVHPVRAESLRGIMADVVTTRACAPLPRLLELAQPVIQPQTVCLFPKGQDIEAELTAAAKSWSMQAERVPSRSDPSGTVLRLAGVRRK